MRLHEKFARQRNVQSRRANFLFISFAQLGFDNKAEADKKEGQKSEQDRHPRFSGRDKVTDASEKHSAHNRKKQPEPFTHKGFQLLPSNI
jgi:hypothetical protein